MRGRAKYMPLTPVGNLSSQVMKAQIVAAGTRLGSQGTRGTGRPTSGWQIPPLLRFRFQSGCTDDRQTDDVLAERKFYQLGSIVNVELAHEIVFVDVYGLGAEFEVRGDFLDGQAVGKQLQNLALPIAE